MTRPFYRCAHSALVALLVAAPAIALAQSSENEDALAKQLANPISSLTSVPFQLNWDTGVGPADDGDRYTLNIQPVIPVSISEDWNMISRTIVPVISQHDIFPGAGSQAGLGDTTESLFFSPKAPTSGGWIWGVGPVFLIPTGTNDLLGSGKWGAGPTAVLLKQTETGWTVGSLVSQVWSFAGESGRAAVNQTYLQPFVAKSLGKGRTLTLDIEAPYNWETNQWTVPFNLMYSKVTRIGKQLISFQGGVRYYTQTPASGPQWGLRFNVTLLFPK